MKGGRHAAPSAPSERLHWAMVRREPVDAETRRLLRIVEQLREVGASVRPAEEFRSVLRAKLLAAAVSPSAERTTPARVVPLPTARLRDHQRQGRFALVAVAVAAVAAAVFVAALLVPPPTRPAPVVQDPGHAKLVAAAGRIKELSPATAQARPDVVAPALDDVDTTVRDGARIVTAAAVGDGDRRALQDLAVWARGQQEQLVSLEGGVDGRTRARIRVSAALLDRVQVRATMLAVLVDCPCLRSPVFDDLGPMPCDQCATGVASSSAAVSGGGQAGIPTLTPLPTQGTSGGAESSVAPSGPPAEAPPSETPAGSVESSGGSATADGGVVVELPGVGSATLSPLLRVRL